MKRPGSGEISAYFDGYARLVPDGEILEILRTEHEETQSLLHGLSEEQSAFRYAEGKWSIRQVVGHLIDSEWVFAYRALRFARGDRTELPGFEENEWVDAAAFDGRRLADLLGEYAALRASTIRFLAGLTEEESSRSGVANNSPMSVRGIAYVIAGHERHHRRVLVERYLTRMESGGAVGQHPGV